MTVRSAGAKSFLAEGGRRTDRHTDITKLLTPLRNFENARKKSKNNIEILLK